MPRRPPEFRSWQGEVFRISSYDTPLWVAANRRSGRWNIAGQTAVQYFCCDLEAPFAEILRYQDLRDETAAQTYRATLWRARADEAAIADYSDFDRAASGGFAPDALVSDDVERCQAEARWLQSHGAMGVLTPSAALPGSVNLTLFGPRVQIAWDRPRLLASQMPVQRLTTSAPPTDLTTRVRYRGQPYAGYEEFMRRQAHEHE